MKVIAGADLDAMNRVMEFTPGGFLSHRFLLAEDGLGITVTRTVIPAKGPQRWQYPTRIEACYCVAGEGELVNVATGERHQIRPDTLYALEKNEEHTFEAIGGPVTLICMFTPALQGNEAHKLGHSYEDAHRSPVYDVRSVPIDKVTANDYNPNSVAPPEMELLETSIWEDGYTQPVVTVYDKENDQYIVVDGFHRFLTLKNSQRIRERENGMLPVVVLDKGISDRMASTIRHNRARGSHNIELMSQIVSELVEMGKGDRWICQHIGMSPDELLRMKQITGLASLFTTREFSEAWEPEAAE